ncbi:MAG: protein translocase subunit SecF [Actinobacteria bacterium]|nr:protein translocase subunit SecF [Actinomycetota bacterium]
MSGGMKRLYRGETTINFYGRRNVGFIASGLLVLVTIVSLFAQGLNLGIDFKGGVAFEVPVQGSISIAVVEDVLKSEGVLDDGIKLQTLKSETESRIRIQLGDQTPEKVTAIQAALAEKAKLTVNDVSVSTVSSTWGRNITMKAINALLVFFLVVSIFISFRFEWRMAISAIVAMAHDVAISVGLYSVLGLEVTPATVVAFLTILGFSLYDTIVVFDKVHENTSRFSGSKVSYGDVVNVSMNQVLMRSLNTSLAAVLPVLSLLVLGSGVFGAVALREFALALLVGLATGAYSSIYIATPLLGLLKERSAQYSSGRGQLSLGADMEHLMSTGAPVSRRASASASSAASTGTAVRPPVDAILSHPPRPRKKSRR